MNDDNHALTNGQLNRLLLITMAMVAVMFAASAYAWFKLPAGVSIPVHWGIDGRPNRFAGKTQGLLIMPFVVLGMAMLFRIIPVIEPRQRNLLRSFVAYRAVVLSVSGFMLVLHIAIIGNLLGIFSLDVASIAGLSMSVLFMAMGNYLSKVRSNFMFGIRTPWTLSSNIAWARTHRLGGRLIFAVGVVGLVLCPLLGPSGFRIFLSLGIATALFTVVYSWLVWRNAPDRQRN